MHSLPLIDSQCSCSRWCHLYLRYCCLVRSTICCLGNFYWILYDIMWMLVWVCVFVVYERRHQLVIVLFIWTIVTVFWLVFDTHIVTIIRLFFLVFIWIILSSVPDGTMMLPSSSFSSFLAIECVQIEQLIMYTCFIWLAWVLLRDAYWLVRWGPCVVVGWLSIDVLLRNVYFSYISGTSIPISMRFM